MATAFVLPSGTAAPLGPAPTLTASLPAGSRSRAAQPPSVPLVALAAPAAAAVHSAPASTTVTAPASKPKSSGSGSGSGFRVSLVVVLFLVVIALGAGAYIGWTMKPKSKRSTATLPAPTTAGSVGGAQPDTPSPSASASPAAAPSGTAAPPAPASASAAAAATPVVPLTPEQRAAEEKRKWEAVVTESLKFVASSASPHVRDLASEDAALALIDSRAPFVLCIYRANCPPSRAMQPILNAGADLAKKNPESASVTFARIETNSTAPLSRLSQRFGIRGVPYFITGKADGTVVGTEALQHTIKRTPEGLAELAFRLLDGVIAVPAPAPAPLATAAAAPGVPPRVAASFAPAAPSTPAPTLPAPAASVGDQAAPLPPTVEEEDEEEEDAQDAEAEVVD
jgi:hypothetical protein